MIKSLVELVRSVGNPRGDAEKTNIKFGREFRDRNLNLIIAN